MLTLLTGAAGIDAVAPMWGMQFPYRLQSLTGSCDDYGSRGVVAIGLRGERDRAMRMHRLPRPLRGCDCWITHVRLISARSAAAADRRESKRARHPPECPDPPQIEGLRRVWDTIRSWLQKRQPRQTRHHGDESASDDHDRCRRQRKCCRHRQRR